MRVIRSRWAAAVLLAICEVWASPLSSAQQTATASPAPAEQFPGKPIYETRCSSCHGLDGAGVLGPNIQGVPLRLGDGPVTSIITNGLPGTGMAAFGGVLKSDEIQQIVDYLRSLGRKDTGVATGDPAKGKIVYDSSGCSSCHIIRGEGGANGPDLTMVGAKRGVNYLKTAILYPGTDLPQDPVRLESGGMTQYLFVHVVTKDGQAMDGTRVIEDSFRIVLKDANGKFHSFRKGDLRELKKEPGKSVMASYKDKLSADEVNNLVAYLAGLKEAYQ